MARPRTPKNRYAYRARPNVTEDKIEAMFELLVALQSVERTSQKLELSHVTVARYFDLIWERIREEFLRNWELLALDAVENARREIPDQFPKELGGPASVDRAFGAIAGYMLRLPSSMWQRDLRNIYSVLHVQQASSANTRVALQQALADIKKGAVSRSGANVAAISANYYETCTGWMDVPPTQAEFTTYIAVLSLVGAAVETAIELKLRNSYWRTLDRIVSASERFSGLSFKMFERTFLVSMVDKGPASKFLEWRHYEKKFRQEPLGSR